MMNLAPVFKANYYHDSSKAQYDAVNSQRGVTAGGDITGKVVG
jgi:hypothetical protein